MRSRHYLAALLGAAAILMGLSFVGAWGLATFSHVLVTRIELGACLPFAAIAWLTLREERRQDAATLRRAAWLILGAAMVMRIALLPWPPLSTDLYRYVWDGWVQAAGINPYRYVPADPALAALRDTLVFPAINRAAIAPTIYPPMAQGVFLLVGLVGGGIKTMKFAMTAFDIAAIAAVALLLSRRRLPPTRVLLYAWHPLPLLEFAGSGHIDAVAIGLMLLACVAMDRQRRAMSGVLLAAATLAKFFPAAIATALYRRRDWRAPLAAVVTLALLYLPYLGVGARVIGYLPGYAKEENLTTGNGFFLLDAVSRWTALPSWATAAYLALGLALLGAAAVAALMRREPEKISLAAAFFLIGAFTLVLSPHLAWYFTWLVPFLCISPRWSIIYLTSTAPLLYGLADSAEGLTHGVLMYLPFFVLLAIEAIVVRTSPTFRTWK